MSQHTTNSSPKLKPFFFHVQYGKPTYYGISVYILGRARYICKYTSQFFFFFTFLTFVSVLLFEYEKKYFLKKVNKAQSHSKIC